MANTLLTPTAVTRESARILHQKLNFVGACDRQYDDSYKNGGATVKGKFGPTLKIRMPNEYTVRTGLTMSAQDTSESSVDLTVSTVKGVDMSFTSSELALSLDDFSSRIIEPAMSVLASAIEADALSMYQDVYNLADGDTVAFGFNSVSDATTGLTKMLAPQSDRFMTMTPDHCNKFRKDTKGLFHDGDNIKQQYREGIIGRTSGFTMYENTLLVPHTTGTAAKVSGYLVNGASQTGSTLVVDTGTTTFLKGCDYHCRRVPRASRDEGDNLRPAAVRGYCKQRRVCDLACHLSGDRYLRGEAERVRVACRQCGDHQGRRGRKRNPEPIARVPQERVRICHG
jgi:hypothetical protein